MKFELRLFLACRDSVPYDKFWRIKSLSLSLLPSLWVVLVKVTVFSGSQFPQRWNSAHPNTCNLGSCQYWLDNECETFFNVWCIGDSLLMIQASAWSAYSDFLRFYIGNRGTLRVTEHNCIKISKHLVFYSYKTPCKPQKKCSLHPSDYFSLCCHFRVIIYLWKQSWESLLT